jgi:MoaA/NifB/PqqE/SkfB family radical SAM enzyme
MNNFFCAAPWRGLHVNPNGDVKTCCAGDPNMLGNLNDHTIIEILNSPDLREIRESIQQGQPHRYCINCVQAEKYGSSERNWHNSVNHDFDVAAASLDEHVPTLVDVRWNTTCNLSCNYCGEKCSSKWAALKRIPVKSNTRNYFLEVCDYLEQHRSSIREVALVGGEPLLLPENDRLLEVLPDNCIVTVITNVSVDFARNSIAQKLQQRHRVGWSLSFDNLGEKFEYVRHGGSWSLLTENLQHIQPLCRSGQHWAGIHAVYNLYNCTNLVEFTEFARSQDITIHWQTLFQPDYLDPQHLGVKTVHLARQEIELLLSKNICKPSEQQFFQQVLNTLTPHKVNLANKFQQHIWEIENKYHTDQKSQFAQLWPELKFLLDTDE